jgi:DtxR family transcriptional regulator, Mn-dependent transcriptional regulator
MCAVRVNATEEEYLQTFLELEEDGVPPIRARLADRLHITPAAVSEGIHRLIDRGLATEENRLLVLTPAGEEAGRAVVRRHRLAECFLVDILDLPWARAHREASRWEHVLSQDVERRIVEILGDPPVCPHGNPIPGSKRLPPEDPSRTLADALPGPVRLIRISEQAQSDDEAIAFLATAGLLPGVVVDVLANAGGAATGTAVRTSRGVDVVPVSIDGLVWVAPA